MDDYEIDQRLQAQFKHDRAEEDFGNKVMFFFIVAAIIVMILAACAPQCMLQSPQHLCPVIDADFA